MLELKLLGSPQILLNGRPVNGLSLVKSQALLFYLALSGRPQSRLALAGLLWPDKREADALANLRLAVYHLRTALPAYLAITRATLAFNLALPCQVDAVLFETELAAANPLAVRQAAVDRYTGEFLAGFYVNEAEPFETWAVVTRERLHHLATETLQHLVADFGARKETALGLRYANQWLALEPWREEAHRYKMQFLAWDGQQQAALAHYERCRQMLAEELGAEPDAETAALVVQIGQGLLKLRSPAQAYVAHGEWQPDQVDGQQHIEGDVPSTSPTLPHNLPTHLTPLIGREQELADLLYYLQRPDHALITLVGSGGMGKTRLALAAAQKLVAHSTSLVASASEDPRAPPFPDGVWFVPLTEVTTDQSTSSEAVINAILQALQFTPTGQTPPREQLLHYLRRKQLLLVLDNFETHLNAIALIQALIQSAPQVRLLLTSRIRLHLPDETVMPLTGLPTPADDDPTAGGYSSVCLFMEHAQRAWPAFTGATTLPAVSRICRLVEGMPLGIELAASWTPHFTCDEIEQTIRQNLALLENVRHGHPHRHHSLQAVFDSSWQLLTADEQRALARAAVFPGSFSRSAFLAITEAQLTDLARLVDQSLLQQQGVGRYAMHELLRQFAWQRLQRQWDEEERLRKRYVDYYAAWLQSHEPELKNAYQPQTVAAIQLDIHNLHIMWQRSVVTADWQAIGKAQESVWYFHYIQGRYQEGEALFARSAAAIHSAQGDCTGLPAPQALILAQVLGWQAWFQMQLGRYAAALELVEKSLASFAQAQQRQHRTVAYVYIIAGYIHIFSDGSAQAIACLEAGRNVAETCGDAWGAAFCRFLLSPLLLPFRHYGQLAIVYRQSLTAFRQLGDLHLIADCLVLLGHTLIQQGAYPEAEASLHESQQICQQLHLHVGLLYTRLYLGELYCARGQYAAAQQVGEQCLQLCVETNDDPSLTAALYNLGMIAYAQQQADEARRSLQDSLRVAERIGSQWAVAMALTPLGYTHLQLGECTQAQAMMQRSYTVAQQITRRENLAAAALGGLAAVSGALGAGGEAMAQYRQAIHRARQIEATPLVLELLVELFELEGALGFIAPEQASVWLRLIQQHPAITQATKARARFLQTAWTVNGLPTMPTADSGLTDLWQSLQPL
ncbi:MAG: tetratricopeptide repeat protein [Caldilineaceae bacterium]